VGEGVARDEGLEGGLREEGYRVAAPEEDSVGGVAIVIIGLGDVDAVDGLRVEDLELAEEAGGLDVVGFEPCVFARKEDDMVGPGIVEGEGGYGAEAIAVLQPGNGLALGRVSECLSR
jgi:hypothetical protein